MSRKSPISPVPASTPVLSVFLSTLIIFVFVGISFFGSFNQFPKDPWMYFSLGFFFSVLVFLIPYFYLDINSNKTDFHKKCKINAFIIFAAFTLFVLTTQDFSKKYFEENIIFAIRFLMIFIYSMCAIVVSRITEKVDNEMRESETFSA